MSVMHVPQLACNLFSVSTGNFIKFGDSCCWFRDKEGRLLRMETMNERLLLRLWSHQVYWSRHPGNQELRQQPQCGTTAGDMWVNRPSRTWPTSSLHQISHYQSTHSYPFVRGVSLGKWDLCTVMPMPTEPIGGNKYFVTSIDNFSRCCVIYFLRCKSEVPDKFKEPSFEYLWWMHWYPMKWQWGRIPVQGIPKLPETPWADCVSLTSAKQHVTERMNRTLLETPWSMMAHVGLPEKDWAEAMGIASYIRNRTPTSATKPHLKPGVEGKKGCIQSRDVWMHRLHSCAWLTTAEV